MKSKKSTVGISLLICLILILSVFTACNSNKDNNGENEPSDENWSAEGDSGYDSVYVDGVELADLVDEALDGEVGDFDGTLGSLTDKQKNKVVKYAEKKGLVIEEDEKGNVSIKKIIASDEKENEILSKADVSGTKVSSKEEYERVSKAAKEEGATAVTDANGNISIYISAKSTTKVHTTKVQTTKAVTKESGTKKYGKNTEYITNAKQQTIYRESTTLSAKGNINEMAFSWVQTKAGGSNASYQKVVPCDDGVVLIGSSCADKNGATIGTYGAMIAKYTASGIREWTDVLYGNEMTSYNDVAVLSDGSIIAVGTTLATNVVSKSEYKCSGTVEGVVVKYNLDGTRQWVKIVGGSEGDIVYSVAATPDGGYVIGGKTESKDGTFKDSGDQLYCAFVAKFNSDGEKVWATYQGGSKHASTDMLAVDSKGNVYAAMNVVSRDGDFKDYESSEGLVQYCAVMKLNSTGKIQWKRSIYESGKVNMNGMTLASSDNGVVLAGEYTIRNGGNTGSFKDFYTGGEAGTTDGVVVHINTDGIFVFKKTLVGFESDHITGITVVPGGYAVTAYTTSTNRDFPLANNGGYDGYVLIINSIGKIKTYAGFSGSKTERAESVCIKNNSLYVAGATNSDDLFFANCLDKGSDDKSVGFVARYDLKISE